jgi:CRP/FNR family transcriptional regulator, nitrogen fixation regulation protein
MSSQRAQAGDSTQSDIVQFAPFFALPGVRMTFQRNEEIFGEGEPADYIYQVKTGAVRTMRFSSDGRRQILAFHLPGDIFGLEFDAAHGFSAEAVAGAEIILVRRSQLESAAAVNGDAARALLQITQRTLLDAREHALLLARKGAGV